MTRALRLLAFGLALTSATPARAQLSVPDIPYDAADILKLPPNLYLGEAVGVATNSRGHIFVYTRSGENVVTIGTSRAVLRGGSRLFEFDPSGKFVKEWGVGVYGFTFAHAVRVDAQDNVWVVDEGSNMVIKFDPQARIVMTMGRKPEALRVPAVAPPAPAAGAAPPANVGAGVPGDNFNRPTDVAWDAAGNIFVADGYGNARVAKFDKNGKFIKSWGQRGTAAGQFDTLHTIAVDAQGNVYVGDRGNRRIQVFDNNGEFKKQYVNVGAPWALCISQGPHPYLYSSNSNGTASMEDGEIYKMELDGTIVGKFGRAGKVLKEFGSVHAIDCRKDNDLLVGEITNWRVQKLTLRPEQAKSTR
ncbi:MAG: peptidyl-alpha-hydroxyglycine alpha-amidating lyase family protein [Vicinamibacterales bacterium]